MAISNGRKGQREINPVDSDRTGRDYSRSDSRRVSRVNKVDWETKFKELEIKAFNEIELLKSDVFLFKATTLIFGLVIIILTLFFKTK